MSFLFLVRRRGLEPPRLAAPAPQTGVATITPPAQTNIFLKKFMVGDEGLEPPTPSV